MPSSKTGSPETIIALDLATRCGWAVVRGRVLVDSGVWVLFRSRKGEHRAQRWQELRRSLADAIEKHRPSVVAYERIRRHVGTSAAHVYGGLLAQLEELDYHCNPTERPRQFDLVPVEVSSWRKETVGRGNALKQDVEAFVRERFGVNPTSDDEAEAIAIAEAVRRMRARK